MFGVNFVNFFYPCCISYRIIKKMHIKLHLKNGGIRYKVEGVSYKLSSIRCESGK